jgi:hypothetical protein
MENLNQEFLPKHGQARLAVERARQIVKDNNEMISRMKSESNIENPTLDDLFLEAQNFSHEDSNAFDLYKIKSSNEIADFIKNIFGVH